jgi:hypothetical protein
MGRILGGLPDFLAALERAARAYGEHGLKLDPAAIEAITRADARARRAERLALILAAGAAIALAILWL